MENKAKPAEPQIKTELFIMFWLALGTKTPWLGLKRTPWFGFKEPVLVPTITDGDGLTSCEEKTQEECLEMKHERLEISLGVLTNVHSCVDSSCGQPLGS